MTKQKVVLYLSPEKVKLLKTWAAAEGIVISRLVEDKLLPPIELKKKLVDLITASEIKSDNIAGAKKL